MVLRVKCCPKCNDVWWTISGLGKGWQSYFLKMIWISTAQALFANPLPNLLIWFTRSV